MKHLLLLTLALLAAAQAPALTVNRRGIPNPALFGIRLGGDELSYYAAVASVRSISMQTYLSASFRVNEINIQTDGGAGHLRIYHSELLSAEELAALMNEAANASGLPGTLPDASSIPGVKDLADRAKLTVDAVTSDIVFKDYPIATHARTIEYRIRSLAELRALYTALISHWTNRPELVADGQDVTVDSTGNESTSERRRPLTLSRTLFTVKQ